MPYQQLAALSLATAVALAPVCAQTTEVGLTMDGGLLTVLYGQDCGPVTCAPFLAGPVGQGQTRSLTIYGAPQTLYVIAIGFPGTCTPVPGFDNVLLLANPVVLDFGVTSSPPFVPTPCQQGVVSYGLTIPSPAPVGVVFRLQGLGVGLGGAFAFGPAIETSIV
jgi:hypothetical protein